MRLFQNQRGSELIEFNFAAVMFFMAMFAAISGGVSIYRYNMLSTMSQEAARLASVSGKNSVAAMQGKGGTAVLVRAEIQQRNQGVPITAITIKSAGADVSPKDLLPGTAVKVTLSSTWLPASGFVPWTAFTISSSSEMLMAR